jgi:hypothetical protein
MTPATPPFPSPTGAGSNWTSSVRVQRWYSLSTAIWNVVVLKNWVSPSEA